MSWAPLNIFLDFNLQKPNQLSNLNQILREGSSGYQRGIYKVIQHLESHALLCENLHCHGPFLKICLKTMALTDLGDVLQSWH
jgi:hypothetical protein